MQTMAENLATLIRKRGPIRRIGVIGMGYVGIPAAALFADVPGVEHVYGFQRDSVTRSPCSTAGSRRSRARSPGLKSYCLLKLPAANAVRQSLAACKRAKATGSLETCEIVVTLFRGHEAELPEIAKAAGDLDLVLQQGVTAGFVPFSHQELKTLAAPLGRRLRIRTREEGEVVYDPSR